MVEGQAERLDGELEGSLGAEGSEENFQKVLDDAAKADQNLASLLLSSNAKAKFESGEKSKLLSMRKEIFKYA